MKFGLKIIDIGPTDRKNSAPNPACYNVFMATPEQMFRSRLVFTPDENTGTSPTGLPNHGNSQQNSPEAPIDDSLSAVENVSSESNQDEVSAIGQASQSLSVPPEPSTEQQAQDIRGTIDMASEPPQHSIRDVGPGVSPMAEGAAQQSDLPAEEIYKLRYRHLIPIPEIAKRYNVSQVAVVRTLREEDYRKDKMYNERWNNFNTTFKAEIDALHERGEWPEDEDEQKKMLMKVMRETAKRFGMHRLAAEGHVEDSTT
jgi:hypothetical protein